MEKVALYFGTDARYVTMPPDHRQLYDNVCIQIINELYPKFLPYYKPLHNTFKELFEENQVACDSRFFKELADAMSIVRMSVICGQEDSFTAHNTRILAYPDALNAYAGGKWGKAAYILIKGAELLGWLEWPTGSYEANGMKLIMAIAEGEPHPIIISSSNLGPGILERIESKDVCISEIKLTKDEFQHLFNAKPEALKIDNVNKSLEEELKNEANKIPYLLHGTDARIVNMTKEERNDFFSCCKRVIDYLWGLFEPLFNGYEMIETVIDGRQTSIRTRKIERYKDLFVSQNKEVVYNNLMQKLWMIETGKDGNQQYQYGDLYLTSSMFKARDYAVGSFAGGELGLVAHRLITAAEIMKLDGLHSDNEVNDAIEKVESFTTNMEDINPVIIKVRDIDPAYLVTDKGEPIDWNSQKHVCQDFRYMQDVKLDLQNAEYLKKE